MDTSDDGGRLTYRRHGRIKKRPRSCPTIAACTLCRVGESPWERGSRICDVTPRPCRQRHSLPPAAIFCPPRRLTPPCQPLPIPPSLAIPRHPPPSPAIATSPLPSHPATPDSSLHPRLTAPPPPPCPPRASPFARATSAPPPTSPPPLPSAPVPPLLSPPGEAAWRAARPGRRGASAARQAPPQRRAG